MIDTLEELLAMSFDEAVDATRADGFKGERTIIDRWIAAKELEEVEKYYSETKDSTAIPEGVFLCAHNGFVMPKWLSVAYIKAFRTTKVFYQAKSWDDVFGKPHPKNTQIGTKREFKEKSLDVYFRIIEIKEQNPDIPIDVHLYETVGRELGVGGHTKVGEWYSYWKKQRSKWSGEHSY